MTPKTQNNLIPESYCVPVLTLTLATHAYINISTPSYARNPS